MKQSLQLKLGQQLTMTPQLQQAIRLLQLSSMELELEVQQALDSNMMLELEEEEARESFDFNSEGAAPGNPGESSDYEGGEAEFGGGEEEFSVPSAAEDIPENLPVDSDWDEIFDNTLAATGPSNPHDDASGEFDNVRSSSGSLREHLLWQVNLLQLTAADRVVAERDRPRRLRDVEADLRQEPLAVVVDQRHERDGDSYQPAGQPGEGVERRIRRRVKHLIGVQHGQPPRLGRSVTALLREAGRWVCSAHVEIVSS